MTQIRLQNCSRTFAHHQVALHPLDLTIHSGETLVLLGPSGCGKTTTLRIISGLERCDSGGEVWFGDNNVTALPIEKRNVGMVFQNYALFPHLDVASNVAYGLRIQGLPQTEIAARVAEMLAMVDLSDYATRAINALSGGQKQRVALARALAARPKVLLFDEPLAALDAKLREKLREDIGTLLRQLGITAVYVTHDQQEAMALGDRIAVMRHGRIEQIATPREIYHQPASEFVAGFVGAINPLTWQGETRYCRPEDIRLVPPHESTFTGEVMHAVFLGQTQRVVVRTGESQSVQVECPARDSWMPGAQVGLQIDPRTLFSVPSHSNPPGALR